MLPAVFWNLAGWAMAATLLLVLRYRLERRRQAVAARAHAEFLGAPVSSKERSLA
jgi:hypothetical protein